MHTAAVLPRAGLPAVVLARSVFTFGSRGHGAEPRPREGHARRLRRNCRQHETRGCASEEELVCVGRSEPGETYSQSGACPPCRGLTGRPLGEGTQASHAATARIICVTNNVMQRDGVLNVRLPEHLKDALRRAASDDHGRSMSGMVARILEEWLGAHGYKVKPARAARPSRTGS
jgi:plasmid stability protein